LPHAPQLLALDCVSTQLAPQAVVLAEQPHLPALQACPAAHAAPHAPQFAASVFKLRQSLPQSTLPLAHVALPLPLTPLAPLVPPVVLGALPPLPVVPAPAGSVRMPAAPAAACDDPTELAHPKAVLTALEMSAARQKKRERLSMVWTPGYEFRSFVNLLPAT
jgi:hypothetical protein